MPILLLLFVLVPIVEIALLLRVGSAIGWFSTLLAVVFTAVLGTWMLRQQGLRTLAAARGRLDAGQLPATELLEGLVLVFGGALLLTPGFVTDAIGFACLIPPSRAWLAARVAQRVQLGAGIGVGVPPGGAAGGPDAGPRGSGGPGGPGGQRPVSGDIIDGEFERVDDGK